MSKELNLFHSSLRSRLFFANGSTIAIERVELGAKYIYERDHLIYSSNNNLTVVQKVNEMDSRCLQMLLEEERQVSKRLPCSEEMFLTLSFLHPSRVLSQIDFAPLAQLPMQHLIHGEDMSKIVEKYRKTKFVDWALQTVFKDGIPVNAGKFWVSVFSYNNTLGEKPFQELAKYALSCMTTPTSNAVVERIFSYVTAVKMKQRNQMSSTMLEAIVRIRTELQFQGKCCNDFLVSPKMLELCNSSMYGKQPGNRHENDEELNFIDI